MAGAETIVRELLDKLRQRAARLLRSVTKAVHTIGATSLLVALLVTVVAGGAYFTLSGMVDPQLYESSAVDVWFEADVARITEYMTSRWSDHYRSKVHPLWSLLTVPPTYFFTDFLNFSDRTAVRTTLTLSAGLAFGSLFLLIRLLGCRILDALAVIAVTSVTAAALFWFTIPETHSLGFLSVLPAIALAAKGTSRPGIGLDIFASAASLSVTTTNWLYGLTAVGLRRRWRNVLVVTLTALGAVTAIWAVQRRLIPSVVFFLGNPLEMEHVLAPESRGVLNVIASVFLYTGVMPAIDVVDRRGAGEWPIMITQTVSPGDASVVGTIAVLAWIGLLACGTWTLLGKGQRWRTLRWFIAVTLIGQLTIFSLFGNETFLYALNYLPLFGVIIAVSCMGPLRRAALALMAVFFLSAAWNNGSQFVEATRFFERYGTYHAGNLEMRRAKEREQSRQPVQPTVLWSPGVREFDWGRFLGGVHFSPGVNTFGITVDPFRGSHREMERLPHGHEPSLEQTIQRDAGDTARFLAVHGDEFRMKWIPVGQRRWRLEFEPESTTPAVRTVVKIRPGGPHGGPIRRLSIRGDEVRINDRWIVDPAVLPTAIKIGCGENQLVKYRSPAWAEVQSAAGRGRASLEFVGDQRFSVDIYDAHPTGPVDRPLDPALHECRVE